MKPLRKSFVIDPLFPFDIVYRTERSQQNELPDHLHDQYELIYVHQGQGTIFIDNAYFEQTPGDVFIIPGNTIHRAFPDASAPVVSTAMFFSPVLANSPLLEDNYTPLQGYEYVRKFKRFKPDLPSDAQSYIESELSVIQEEFSRRQRGYREAIRLSIGRILLRMNRCLEGQVQMSPTLRVGPDWLEAALSDIDQRPEDGLSLDVLARRANVSPAHFSRVFKKLTGMNVTDYVNTKRIIAAKSYLLETALSVSRIAELCGFESLPHFHRTFKNIAGETPGSYRKHHALARMPNKPPLK